MCLRRQVGLLCQFHYLSTNQIKAVFGLFVVEHGHRAHLVDHFETGYNLAEHRVLSVKCRLRCKADEERRAGTVQSFTTGHRETSLLMFQVAELRLQVLHELGRLLSGDWNSTCCNVAALNHEPCYDPVPHRIVEQARLAQFEEIPHSFWCLVWKELDFNIPQCCDQAHMMALHHFHRRVGKWNRLWWW